VADVTVGILCSSPEGSASLRDLVNATGLAVVQLEVHEYCVAAGDRSARRFTESTPAVILVDMDDQNLALQSLRILHSALPATWLFVSGDGADTQAIIESMRAGAREFLPKPLTGKALQQALGRYISEKHKETEAKTAGKLYCVTSAKAGAGATSIAVNLAVALASAAEVKVALLDLTSAFSDVAAFLNLRPKFTIEQALASSSRLDSALLDSYTSSAYGVSILPGVASFDPGRTLPVAELARVLQVAAETYHYCICDFPVFSGKESFQLASQISTAILVAVTPDLPSLWRTEQLVRFLEGGECVDRVRLIVNRSRSADEIRDTEIQQAVKHPVFWKLPGDDASCTEAVNSGKPVVLLNGSELARSYRELAQELTGVVLPDKRRSFFKLFS